jgi:hypothetical protein
VAREAARPLIVSRTSNLPNKCDVSGMEEIDIKKMFALSPNSRFSSFSLKEETQE